MLEALRERGHEVTLLTDMPELADGTGVRVRVVRLGAKLASRTAASVLLQAPVSLMRIARALRREQPVAVVLAHFKKEQLLCSLLPRRLAPRVVWCEWGPMPMPMRRGPARMIYALAARRARRVIAVSQGTADTIIAAGVPAAKVIVVPDMVNLHTVAFDPDGRRRLRREWGADDQTLVIGCISRLQRRKRNDVLIDAFAHVDGDAMLVISGEGDEEQALRARAAPHGDRVRFLPNARGHVDELLSACDLLGFAPSPTEADRPRVIVMAQLVGLPVLATDAEGASAVTVAGAGTVVVPHNDPQAVARAIAEYRDQPERRREEGERGRRAIRQTYDPAATLAEVERAFGLFEPRRSLDERPSPLAGQVSR